MNIRDILAIWLKENGYDGLYEAGECACEISDLMPCDNVSEYCEAGYKTKANPESGYDFMIGPNKEESHENT